MYAQMLGPGHVAELHPLSPDGVEVGYSHEYVAERMRERNLYGYVNNNPANLLDPSGLAPIECKCRAVHYGGFTGSTSYFWVGADCQSLASSCCRDACAARPHSASTYVDWTGEWHLTGAGPDVSPPIDWDRHCANADWSKMDWLDCTGCCIRYWDPGAILERSGVRVPGTASPWKEVGAVGITCARVPKGQSLSPIETTHVLVKISARYGNKLTSKVARFVSKGGLLVVIGMADFYLVESCASSCACDTMCK